MSILRFRIIIITLLALFLALPFVFNVSKKPTINQSSTDLAIGNSHARAINFHAMGLVGHNGYISSSDVRQTINSYYTLQPSLPSLNRVWIPVAPGYIFKDNTLPKWGRKERLLSNLIDDYNNFRDETKYFYDRESYFWSAGQRRLILLRKRFLNDIQSEETLKIVEGANASEKIVKPEEIEQLAQSTALGHRKNTSLQNTANVKRLDKFLEHLGKKDITVIFFTPPYTAEYYNHILLADFEASYRQKISQLLRNHSNAHYFDFHDFFNKKDYSYFHDDDHLNLTGAIAFSRKMQEAVSDKIELH